ncbi:MAG: hypothetical protein R3E92_08695 [Burkholderiaceae bacterium]
MDAGHGGFGIDAAMALCAIGQRQLDIANDTPFRGPPAFSNVRARRAERQGSSAPATCSIAEAIFAAVDKLLQDGAVGEAQVHALQLAATGLGLPYGDKCTIIDRLQRLPQPYGTKLRFFTALVNAGELIDAQLIVESIDALLEDAKTKPWLLQENQGEIDRWLVLLPFTDRPEVTMEVLVRLHPHIRLPWRLRPLLSALGFAPSDRAELVLMGLAKRMRDSLSDYDWLAALEKRDTLSSLRMLLDLICGGEARGKGAARHLDLWPKASGRHAVPSRSFVPMSMRVASGRSRRRRWRSWNTPWRKRLTKPASCSLSAATAPPEEHSAASLDSAPRTLPWRVGHRQTGPVPTSKSALQCRRFASACSSYPAYRDWRRGQPCAGVPGSYR